jgi:hypothetical protein
MSLSRWNEGRYSDHVTGQKWDIASWLATVKSLPGNMPSYHATGARGG